MMMRVDRFSSVRNRGFAIAGVALALVFTPGCSNRSSIRVETDPAGAMIACNGKSYPNAPYTITGLSGGTYVISAAKPGFRETRQALTIQSGQRVTVPMKLEPLRGLVLVRSNPSGAEVSVDGAFRGRTPFFITDLPLGTHRFVFTAQTRLARELEFTVEDRTPRLVSADLPLNAGKLVVRSEPAGATVRLNGADKGVTPLEIADAPAGENMIEITHDGFQPFTTRIPMAAQETKEIMSRLTPLPTRLRVVSLPEGARVYVDDEFRGTAPMDFETLDPGEHRVRAELPGHEISGRTIRLVANAPMTEEFRLVRNSGQIVLVTEPPGVRAFLNGEDRGVTVASNNPLISAPLTIDLLKPGPYTLQLTRAGYRHAPRSITIKENEVVPVHEKLIRLFIPDTRVTVQGGVMREGMLLKRYSNGKIDLQLESGSIISLDRSEILKMESMETPAPR